MKTLQNILEINKSWKTFSGSNDTWKKTYSKKELAYPEELEIDELVFILKKIDGSFIRVSLEMI